jgi:hypothetical protein
MAGWRVRSNHLGAIGKKMPRELDDGVDEVAEAMVRQLKATLWVDSGMIRRVTTEKSGQPLHSEVQVGWYRWRGFYSGFQEFGVASRGIPARPIVTPTAHQHERQYRLEMAERVRKACEAR